MNTFEQIACILILMLTVVSCQSQNNQQAKTLVGGGCEGCEAVFESGNRALNNVDTLPGFLEAELKLKIEGTVFKIDGVTPAPNVLVYIYHTNKEGLYVSRGKETGWGKRHGSNRGWVKTDKRGKYVFYTFRPGAYPNGSEPEHIHLTVKEPGINEYYLDEYVFTDDPLLTKLLKEKLPNRGGSGLVTPNKQKAHFLIKRNLHLGLNIPNYR